MSTGFGVEGVPALIAPSRFYELLSQGKFPLATFLRRREHIDYIEEPDLFHEVFGHCPLLTNQSYANFVKRFGEAAVELGKGFSWHLFRIFWFTVEFGLINTSEGRRCFGAGIVSSPSEAKAAMDGTACEFRPFDLISYRYRPADLLCHRQLRRARSHRRPGYRRNDPQGQGIGRFPAGIRSEGVVAGGVESVVAGKLECPGNSDTSTSWPTSACQTASQADLADGGLYRT
jgi:Biopterin-dependent aromatic amino acid hydroxylase